MTDFNPEGYSLDQMTDDEKNGLLVKLANAFNNGLVEKAMLHDVFVHIADTLEKGDALGTRAKYMRNVARYADMVASAVRTSLGVDAEQLRVDSDFEDLVRDLDLRGDSDE